MNVITEDKKIIPFEQKDEGEKSETQTMNPIEVAVESLANINPELGDFQAFATMLAAPEPVLKSIEPVILQTIEAELSDSNNALEIATALNIANIKEEEFAETFEAICLAIQEQLGDDIQQYQKDFLKKFFAVIFKAVQDTKVVSKRIIEIPIELCHENAKIPTYANIGDAGLDIYALDDYTIMPGETMLIPTGFKVAVPKGYELQVRPKSGRALKTKLRVANTPGTIDSGYRDEVGVIVENIEAPIKDIEYTFAKNGQPIIKSIEHGKPFYIEKGSKFAQLVLNEIPTAHFFKVKDINAEEGNRGGGFGSSGLF